METLTPEIVGRINQKRLIYADKIYRITHRMTIESDVQRLIELIYTKENLLNCLRRYEKKLSAHLKVLNNLNFPENFRKEYSKRLNYSAEINQDVLQKCLRIKDKLYKDLQGFEVQQKLSKYLSAPE